MTEPSHAIRVIFMGSDAVACPLLDALKADRQRRLCGVVTQPDRPQKRNRRPQPCAVKRHLDGSDLPIWTPERINAPDAIETLCRVSPDVIVVMAYGQFLGDDLLTLPPWGCLNVHLSLLPKYRGAAPIQWAIANGESETGITVMRMVRRMDAGDILDQATQPIQPGDTAERLGRRLAEAAPPLLLNVLERLARGECQARPQNENEVTFAPILKKEDGRVDWTQSAETIERRIRAFTPWPGCFCVSASLKDKRLRILRARVEPAPSEGALARNVPGTVLDINADGPLIATANAALRLLDVQPEGKRPMPGAAYCRGHAVRTGTPI